MSKKPLEIDMIAGSQLRDSQGEMLNVEGADISELENGNGRLNDNHGQGFYNSIGRVTFAKKIFKQDDCTDDRQKYYWEKVKSPYIYVKGVLYDDEEHPNARAAAAILRNIHKSDTPLKIKSSVEGGVQARGIKDPTLLARTKIHSVALTFIPANQATLVEPIGLDKSIDISGDENLIKSVQHLAKQHVPSFRQVERNISAEKIKDNIEKIRNLAKTMGIEVRDIDIVPEELAQKALEHKVQANIHAINQLTKALTAGYGGASAPTNATGGAVLMPEAIDKTSKINKKEFTYITCYNCGKEQIHSRHQVKCRNCGKSFPLEQLQKLIN